MKIALASDHGGFHLKEPIKTMLEQMGHEVKDLGAHCYDADDDYPDFARYLGQAIRNGHADRGVLLCGSGVGASIAATKIKGVRAAICHDAYSAHQGVEHDNMNVLCLGSRIIGEALALELVKAFANAEFSNAERHLRRLQKVEAIEAAN